MYKEKYMIIYLVFKSHHRLFYESHKNINKRQTLKGKNNNQTTD